LVGYFFKDKLGKAPPTSPHTSQTH